MKALDTNIVVRLIVGDDSHQQAVAQALVQAPATITPTVLIETGWVLAGSYGFGRGDIVSIFEILLDHPAIHFPASDRIRWALGRYAEHGDFADLIHIAASGEVTAFATFDRGVAAAAGIDSPVPIETLA